MVLKSKKIIHADYDVVQKLIDDFLVGLTPEQVKAIQIDNGIVWIIYDDQAPNKLASLNLNKVSPQPSGDPTINDDPQNTATWIQDSCSNVGMEVDVNK